MNVLYLDFIYAPTRVAFLKSLKNKEGRERPLPTIGGDCCVALNGNRQSRQADATWLLPSC
jgi:hypothetical protein